jgi:hypothetical protein
MSKLILISLLYLITCQHVDAKTAASPKIYNLNLDLPVKERYRAVIADFQHDIGEAAKLFQKRPEYEYMASIGAQVTKQDPDWLAYTRLVSEITGLTIGESVMLSSTYELGCTSALIRDSNDKVIFGRNLDFKNNPQKITQVVYEAHYYKEGRLVYKGVEIAGFFGSINSVKPGKFAISLNTRSSYFKNNILRIIDGYRTPAYNIMKIMESAESYEKAVWLLSKVPLTADVYYTIASSDNGSIITRDVTSDVRIDKLEGDKWFLVIANTDLEDPNDIRRKLTEESIRSLGRNFVNYDTVFHVMKQPPTFTTITISTTIQSALGHFDSTVWLND